MNQYMEETEQVLVHAYNKQPIVLERGEGVYLYDTAGRKYLDFAAGFAVCGLGYGNEELLAAVTEQMHKLIHTSNVYYNTESLAAARALQKISGLDRIFFTNSGAEAIEGALKAARKYGQKAGRYEIIAMENSFHGRTLGALSVTGTKSYREPFEPLIGGVSFAVYNDLASVKALVNERTCAIILEPLQGEGGIHPATPEFLAGLRTLCDETGILLIADEIQCGMGRSGDYFVYQKYGLKPDILVCAKAIGSGFPVGAFALTEAVAAHSLEPGDHGTTYGGNPLVLRAVSKTVEIFEKTRLLEHVQSVGTYLAEQLDKLAAAKESVRERRGLGLMQGLELTASPAPIISRALEHGVLLIAAGGNVIRFVPPLIIEREHVDRLIEVLDEILG